MQTYNEKDMQTYNEKAIQKDTEKYFVQNKRERERCTEVEKDREERFKE